MIEQLCDEARPVGSDTGNRLQSGQVGIGNPFGQIAQRSVPPMLSGAAASRTAGRTAPPEGRARSPRVLHWQAWYAMPFRASAPGGYDPTDER